MRVNKFVLVSFLLLPLVSLAQDGKGPRTGEWIKKEVIVRHDSKWSTEHCFELSGRESVRYRFTTAIQLDFDFHVHPITEEGGYQTEHLDRKKNTSARKGQAEAEGPGTYCFNFIPVENLREDAEIRLSYRIELPDNS